MYDDKATCEEAISAYTEYGVDLCEPDHWMGVSKSCCTTCALKAEAAVGVFAVHETSSHFVANALTYGFAAFGFSAIVYGAGRHYYGENVKSEYLEV
jgi:hypothetical protein